MKKKKKDKQNPKQTKQTRSKEQKNLEESWWWSTGMEKHAMKQGEKHSSEMKGKYWRKDGNAGWAWRNGQNWIPRRNWAPSWWVKCCNNPILIIRESHLCYLFNFLLLCKYRDSCFPLLTQLSLLRSFETSFERSAELIRSLNILSDRSFRFPKTKESISLKSLNLKPEGSGTVR